MIKNLLSIKMRMRDGIGEKIFLNWTTSFNFVNIWMSDEEHFLIIFQWTIIVDLFSGQNTNLFLIIVMQMEIRVRDNFFDNALNSERRLRNIMSNMMDEWWKFSASCKSERCEIGIETGIELFRIMYCFHIQALIPCKNVKYHWKGEPKKYCQKRSDSRIVHIGYTDQVPEKSIHYCLLIKLFEWSMRNFYGSVRQYAITFFNWWLQEWLFMISYLSSNSNDCYASNRCKSSEKSSLWKCQYQFFI